MYTTTDRVRGQFPQIRAEQWGTGYLPSDPEIEDTITRASGRVDDYCRAVYVLPFEPDTPDTIEECTLQLAVADLRRRFNALGAKADEKAADAEASAIRTLTAIGQNKPPFLNWTPATGVESPSGAPIASTPPTTKLFTRDEVW
ncbi:MAG: phage protein Gp36 family protein [Armatimonadia bacterium]